MTFFQSLFGALLLKLELLLPGQSVECKAQVGDFSLEQVLKTSDTKIGFSVGLYTKDGNSYVIKTVNFRTKHQLYSLLCNEAFMTKFLRENNTKNDLEIPEYIDLFEKDNTLFFIRTYIAREEKKYTEQQYLKAFDTCLDFFHHVPFHKYPNLPRRTAFYGFLWMLPYFILSALKQPKNASLYFSLLLKYFRTLTLADFISPQLSLIHRDLTPANIFTSNQKIALIDLETMMVGNDFTDIANFPRKYFATLKAATIENYLSSKIVTDVDRRSFTWQSIFDLLQFLAVEDRKSSYYAEALRFLPFFNEELLPRFTPAKRSFYECVSSVLFTLLSIFPSSNKNNLILCYHSVNLSDWRFSTPPNYFRDQVKYLMRHFQVVPLSTLLAAPKKSGMVSITFDDAYEDVLNNAFPILERKGLKATIFALGEPDRANRKELSNSLKLLSPRQLTSLRDRGWEIGFHTATHADLSSLSLSELEAEIGEAKATFEKELGSEVRYFAYPRGMYNTQITNLVEKAGFKAAFTVNSGNIDSNDCFRITRVPLEGTISLGELRGLLTSTGMSLHHLLLKLLQMKENILRIQSGKQIQT